MSSDFSISVRELGKQYTIGKVHNSNETLRDLIVDSFKAPFQWIKNKRTSGNIQPDNRSRMETIWALEDISFEVKSGEVFGLIGHNGAGKSTLLKVLSRITEPTTGKVIVNGRVGSLLEVGTGFHPELTGRENILLNGAILGMHRYEINRKFDEIVEFAEIEKFLDMPVKRYSSGMYVRLAFAVAAHLEPEILLVDEVLAVGDAAFQKKCLGKMDDVARGGRTILFVSHNMNAIQRLCPKSILLERGRLVEFGDTVDVVANYLSSSSGAYSPEIWIDLTETSRSGVGEAQFTRVWYSSNFLATGGHPYPTGPLQFKLAIDSVDERNVGSMAVTIYDQYGTKLVNAETMALGRILKLHPGENIIDLKIKNLFLNPGIYVVGFWLANPSGDVFDHISSAIKIEVVEYETERLGGRPKSDGIVSCDFDVMEIE